eukprot:1304937-Prymnesium_polylepis.1
MPAAPFAPARRSSGATRWWRAPRRARPRGAPQTPPPLLAHRHPGGPMAGRRPDRRPVPTTGAPQGAAHHWAYGRLSGSQGRTAIQPWVVGRGATRADLAPMLGAVRRRRGGAGAAVGRATGRTCCTHNTRETPNLKTVAREVDQPRACSTGATNT